MNNFADDITPVILTANEEANIGRTLDALSWAREVVVVDSFSTDRTVEIARAFTNVRIVQRHFDGLASQWTYAVHAANTEWVLMLDADYYVPPAFVREIAALQPRDAVGGFEAPFRYAIRGKPLHASLYPPRPVLVRKDACEFFMDGHTQRVRVNGELRTLHESLLHDDRKSFARFLERQRVYMRAEAQKIRRGENLNLPGRIRRLRVVAPFAVLIHSLFVRGLILDGVPGLIYTFERVVAEVILSIELFRRSA